MRPHFVLVALVACKAPNAAVSPEPGSLVASSTPATSAPSAAPPAAPVEESAPAGELHASVELASYSGDAPTAQVADDINKRLGGALEQCTSDWVANGAAKPGRLELTVAIMPDGSLAGFVERRDTIRDGRFYKCALAALKKLRVSSKYAGGAMLDVVVK
jgi:hypothetical protein